VIFQALLKTSFYHALNLKANKAELFFKLESKLLHQKFPEIKIFIKSKSSFSSLILYQS
jgi:hypothetical protein